MECADYGYYNNASDVKRLQDIRNLGLRGLM